MPPNFIIVGTAKAGTTAIYDGLQQHPEIFLPPTKELHYFSYPEIMKRTNGPGDKYIIPGIIKSWSEYCKLFKGTDIKHMARGDISPSYLFFPSAASRIKDKLGSVRIIIILRNPVDKIFSQYCHLVRDGREMLSFSNGLEQERKRSKMGWSDMWLYKESGHYCAKVKEYMRIFGKKSVLVLFYEDFKSDQIKTLQKITRFIGVSGSYNFKTPENLNVSGIPRSILLSRYIIAGPVFVMAKKYFPIRLGRRIKRFLMQINTGKRPVLSDQLREALFNEYRQDIDCLCQLIEQDIKWI